MIPHLQRQGATPAPSLSTPLRSSPPDQDVHGVVDRSSGIGLECGDQSRVVSAGAADHVAIHRFLMSVFHGPTAAEYHAQLEDPRYEPPDRLLIKRGDQIVSHLRMTYRELRFGSLRIPTCIISDVATSPEYRRRGFASALLDEVHRRMQRDSIRLGILKTSQAPFYARHGWAVGFRHSYCSAGARDLLAALPSFAPPAETRDALGIETPRPPLTVRLWRHVEQAALMRLYDQNPACRFGPMQRDEAYWRWLISRRGYDRIYVAIEGPDTMRLDDTCHPIVGYAVMRDGRIVELMTDKGRPDVAAVLIQRAGMDAIEHDDLAVRLDAPPSHPLWRAFVDAGGAPCYHEAEQGQVHMVRLFRPLALLAQLYPLLLERARQTELSLPCELGLLLDDQKHRLVLTRRSAKVLPGKLGRSYLKLSAQDLTLLLLGHLDIDEAVELGRIVCSTSVAHETARTLLPRVPLWLPPWDDLPAAG